MDFHLQSYYIGLGIGYLTSFAIYLIERKRK